MGIWKGPRRSPRVNGHRRMSCLGVGDAEPGRTALPLEADYELCGTRKTADGIDLVFQDTHGGRTIFRMPLRHYRELGQALNSESSDEALFHTKQDRSASVPPARPSGAPSTPRRRVNEITPERKAQLLEQLKRGREKARQVRQSNAAKKALSETEIRMNRFRGWISQGIRVPGYDLFLEWYESVYLKQTECEGCAKPIDGRFRCVDHHHTTGCIRLICCHGCNRNLAQTDKHREALHKELLTRQGGV